MRIELLPADAANEGEASPAFRRCLEIRHVVFVLGQSVSEELEFDGLDAGARHFLAYWEDEPTEAALGTARFRIVDGVAKAERIAVLESARGLGLGRALVEAIESHARVLGLDSVRLNAQVRVSGFYERLGYEGFGEPFVEADIDHRSMKKSLA